MIILVKVGKKVYKNQNDKKTKSDKGTIKNSFTRISVCLATYNGSKYLFEQIDSILTQLGSNDELIISDDHSVDNTGDLIKKINDPRIKLVYNKYEKGYTKNFQNALENSQGEYIFLADQDDVWFPQKVRITMDYLENNKYDMVISDCMIVNEDLIKIEESYFITRGSKSGLVNTLIKANYLGCCMAFNRKVMAKSIPFPNNHKRLPHDLWIGLVGYAFFNVKTTSVKLIMYRRHSSNASDGGNTSKNTLFTKIYNRVYAIINLIKVLFK